MNAFARSLARGLCLSGCLALVACAGVDPIVSARPLVLPAPVAGGAPTNKAIIHAVLQSANLPLGTDPSCSHVGTEPGDDTIGAYLSGFLAEQGDPEMRNSIQVTTIATSDAREGPVWQARMLIAQEHGEVVWRWGVEFLIRRSDRAVIRDSFRCVGAG